MTTAQTLIARHDHLWIKHTGLWFRVLAVFAHDHDANAYMYEHEYAAVLVVHGDFVFIADKRDMGHKAPSL